MDEVARSIRVGSTPCTEPFADWRRLGFALGGFVAGEGCFSVHRVGVPSDTGSTRVRFRFSVMVAERDAALVSTLHRHLNGAGGVHRSPARRAGWQPTVSLQVTAIGDHLRATIPFAEQFLHPASRKYDQFQRWNECLQSYRRERARRAAARPMWCTTPGCDRPIRARGLCRGCYWRATGH